jgi:hypothetical protein
MKTSGTKYCRKPLFYTCRVEPGYNNIVSDNPSKAFCIHVEPSYNNTGLYDNPSKPFCMYVQ